MPRRPTGSSKPSPPSGSIPQAARGPADQLPLTLTFRDFNGVEKIADLPRPLTTAGVPAGADPDVNDIGYYAPSGNLVFYYGDVGYWDGIVRIGQFDTDDRHHPATARRLRRHHRTSLTNRRPATSDHRQGKC